MTRQTRAVVWVCVGVGLLTLLASCGVVCYRLWAGFVELRDTLRPESPHFAIRPTADGRVEFHLSYDPAAQGLTTLTVLDSEDNVLWQINGQGVGRTPVVVYGQLPAEPGVRWTQLVPVDGSPPPDVRGRRVKVSVTGTYSGHLGVQPQTVEAAFDVPT